MKKKMNKTKKAKKGGLLTRIHNDNAFGEFLMNSQIKKIGSGSSGFVFEVSLVNRNYHSPYYSLNSNVFNKQVTSLLIKMVVINDNEKREELFNKNFKLSTTKRHEFIHEINTQNHIYNETMGYLQPICPSIIHSEIAYGNNAVNTLIYLKKITANQKVEQYIFNKMINYLKIGKIKGVGIIGMEYKNASTLHELKDDINFEKYKNMALFSILRLAIETGYNHGDYHPSNIFIDTKDNSYFLNCSGSPSIIDYGFSYKMPIVYIRNIINFVKNKRYVDALEIICKQNRSDNVNLNNYPSLYGWLCSNFDYKNQVSVNNKNDIIENINNEIKILHDCFEKSNLKRKEIFAIKNNTDKMYPILPIVLNQVIDGKKYEPYYLEGGKSMRKKNNTRKYHNNT